MTRPMIWQDLEAGDCAWQIPDRLDVAEACTDNQARHDMALVVDEGDTHECYTFGQLGDLSRRFAQFLVDRGVAAGDRVAVMVPQGMEVVVSHLGSFRLGAVTVPLSVKFGPEAVAFRLTHSGTRLLVIDAANFGRVRDVLGDLPDLRTVIVVGRHPIDETELDGVTVVALTTRWTCPHGQVLSDTGPQTPAIIIYTSGTTGHPKGALHGHQILPAHMPGMRTAFMNAPQPGDVFWTPADWAWIGGLLIFTGLYGSHRGGGAGQIQSCARAGPHAPPPAFTPRRSSLRRRSSRCAAAVSTRPTLTGSRCGFWPPVAKSWEPHCAPGSSAHSTHRSTSSTDKPRSI